MLFCCFCWSCFTANISLFDIDVRVYSVTCNHQIIYSILHSVQSINEIASLVNVANQCKILFCSDGWDEGSNFFRQQYMEIMQNN